jgi:hypothetical protein
MVNPMAMGLRLAGSVEFGGLRAAPGLATRRRAAGQGDGDVPAPGCLAHSRWMGHRPCLPDSLPVIGRAPHLQRVARLRPRAHRHVHRRHDRARGGAPRGRPRAAGGPRAVQPRGVSEGAGSGRGRARVQRRLRGCAHPGPQHRADPWACTRSLRPGRCGCPTRTDGAWRPGSMRRARRPCPRGRGPRRPWRSALRRAPPRRARGGGVPAGTRAALAPARAGGGRGAAAGPPRLARGALARTAAAARPPSSSARWPCAARRVGARARPSGPMPRHGRGRPPARARVPTLRATPLPGKWKAWRHAMQAALALARVSPISAEAMDCAGGRLPAARPPARAGARAAAAAGQPAGRRRGVLAAFDASRMREGDVFARQRPRAAAPTCRTSRSCGRCARAARCARARGLHAAPPGRGRPHTRLGAHRRHLHPARGPAHPARAGVACGRARRGAAAPGAANSRSPDALRGDLAAQVEALAEGEASLQAWLGVDARGGKAFAQAAGAGRRRPALRPPAPRWPPCPTDSGRSRTRWMATA